MEQPSRTSRFKLLTDMDKLEKHWTWKAGLRLPICVFNIVGIGCVSWLMASSLQQERDTVFSFFGFRNLGPGLLVTFYLSLFWCVLAILIPLVRKPSRPLHPGIAVGMDLVFWLGFLAIAILTLGAVFNVDNFGAGNWIRDPNIDSFIYGYSGNYAQAPNGTWVYQYSYIVSTRDNGYYNRTLGMWIPPSPIVNGTSVVNRTCTPLFPSCEAQDDYINQQWRQKPTRFRNTVTANAVQWLNVSLHFGLFVWACVDTHRRRQQFSLGKERRVVERVMNDLATRGIIRIEDGEARPIHGTNE